MNKTLILASSSPRRQELLRKVNIPFTLRKQHVDEKQICISDPAEKVKQLAILKGRSTPIDHTSEVILSADTVVSFNKQIFEKPADKEEARKMITALSGETHDVFTGIMIRSLTEESVFVEQTKVEFWSLSYEEIDWYISTDEPYDKAGAYGIQNLGAILVRQIIGDYFTVVGLPLSKTVRELKKFSIYPKN